MAGRALLSADVDSKHRAKIWESGGQPHLLRTRTPSINWELHPDWIDRYVGRNNFIYCLDCQRFY